MANMWPYLKNKNLEVIKISWTRILAVHPKTMKKKMDWYERQKLQTELGEFLEEEKPKEKKVKLAYDGVKLE